MKESEAKKKWCPKAIHVVDATGYASGNRFIGDGVDQNNSCLCLGSNCMIWEAELKFEEIEKEVKIEPKWEDYTKHESNGFKKHHIEVSKKDGFVAVIFNRYVDSESGDCGLKTKELYCEGCNH